MVKLRQFDSAVFFCLNNNDLAKLLMSHTLHGRRAELSMGEKALNEVVYLFIYLYIYFNTAQQYKPITAILLFRLLANGNAVNIIAILKKPWHVELFSDEKKQINAPALNRPPRYRTEKSV